jgi:hypothetical protein
MENIPLTEEQRKRIELLEAYEAKTAPEFEARNTGIDKFESEQREKWLQLQSSIEATRGEIYLKMKSENAPDQAISSTVAMELAKVTEGFYFEKDKAARELDKTLAQPQTWVDFLKESKEQNPDDPTLDSLLEEAQKAPSPTLEGFSKRPPPNIVLADLHAKQNKDGVIEYIRGMSVTVRDVGDRLDVKKTDDRDIEAALKIASQKFDMDKGLLLTGDAAFKVRAAEIAGRLGYPLQNSEPEILKAWMKGKQAAQSLDRAKTPSVEAGITGDPAQNLAIAPIGLSVLRADQRSIDSFQQSPQTGVELAGDDKVSIPADRMLAANATIKDLSHEAIDQIARVDLQKPNGGIETDPEGLLQKKGILDADGKLTELGIDVVLVRDDRIIRERESLNPEHAEAIGKYYKTSGDYVRAALSKEQKQVQVEMDEKKEKAPELTQQQEPEQEAAQEKATEQVQEEKAREVEIEEKQIKPSRPKRSRAPKKQMEGMEL